MRLCALETTLIEGSSPTEQLMQACMLAATVEVQMQVVVVQDYGNIK